MRFLLAASLIRNFSISGGRLGGPRSIRRFGMKKLLMLFGLILVLSPIHAEAQYLDIRADSFSIVYIDTLSAGETTATDVRADTVLSDLYDMERMFRFMSFYTHSYIPAGFSDTNFLTDTFFVKFQHSMDKVTWTTVDVDTFFDTGSGWSSFVFDSQDSAFGRWGRFMFIHWDSLEVTATLTGNTYRKAVDFFIRITR